MPKNYRRSNNRNSGRREEAAAAIPATAAAEGPPEGPPEVSPPPPAAASAGALEEQEQQQQQSVGMATPSATSEQHRQELAPLEVAAAADKDTAAAAQEQQEVGETDATSAEGEVDPMEGGCVGAGSPEAAAEAQQHAADLVAAEDAALRERQAAAAKADAESAAAELAMHHHVSLEQRASQSREERPKLGALGVNSTLAAAADPVHSPTYVPSTRDTAADEYSEQQQQQQAPLPPSSFSSASALASTSRTNAGDGGRHVTISPVPVVMGDGSAAGQPPAEAVTATAGESPDDDRAAPSRHTSELVPLRRADSTAAPTLSAKERSWPRASTEEDRGTDVAEAAEGAAVPARVVVLPAKLAPASASAAGRVIWCDVAIVLGAAAFIARCI